MTLIENYISNNYFGRLLGMNFTILEDGAILCLLLVNFFKASSANLWDPGAQQ